MDYYTLSQKRTARLAAGRRERATLRTSMLQYQASHNRALEEMRAVEGQRKKVQKKN